MPELVGNSQPRRTRGQHTFDGRQKNAFSRRIYELAVLEMIGHENKMLHPNLQSDIRHRHEIPEWRKPYT
jgi:hypothetical protein